MRRDPYGGESAQGYRFRQMEIEYGPFQRIIPIPCPVDARTARAQVTAGILKIYLPKAPAAAQVKIAVAMES
jgi:HSP20 family molecular chaperone IbpA